jgi:hypothetical protein
MWKHYIQVRSYKIYDLRHPRKNIYVACHWMKMSGRPAGGKSPLCPLNKMLIWPRAGLDTVRKSKGLLILPGFFCYLTRSLSTMSTELMHNKTYVCTIFVLLFWLNTPFYVWNDCSYVQQMSVNTLKPISILLYLFNLNKNRKASSFHKGCEYKICLRLDISYVELL